MADLPERFRAQWTGFRLPPNRPVLLALSGGIDSMALAQLLLDAAIPFAAAHCNFSLRAEESDGDEAFLREWASARRLKLHVRCFETKSLTPAGQSIQMTARKLRYDWFEQLRNEAGYAAVLTAHHSDDLAETVLINLLRGTGLSGLQGIPLRNAHIIRPLLFATRADIRAYAEEKGLSWREDSSNASDKYLRNAIRHRVLPELERLQPGAGARISQTARFVAGSLPFYRTALDAIMKRLIEPRGRDYYIPLRLLRKQPQPETILYEIFQPFGFGGEQVADLIALMDAQSGKWLQSGSHRVIRDREFMILTALDPIEADLISVESPDSCVRCRSGEIRFRLIPVPETIPADPDLALLDSRDIRFPLTLRPRREGDYFYPLGMGGKKKKLKRYLIDVKMPQPGKERLLVLEQRGRILWIVGSRIDERYRIRPDTKQVLEVRLVRD